MKNSVLDEKEIEEKINLKKKQFEERIEKRRQKFEEKVARKKERFQRKSKITRYKIKKRNKKLIKKLEEVDKIKDKPRKTSIWRILAYFIIYSFFGYVIETVFAIFNYGIWESRQSFLYGPFCCIYGLGATIIILVLRYRFFKNNHTLFVGGFIVGSIVEYIVSFLGELILNVKWWDYSNRFLNINGRICLLYSIFWGLLGVYLLRVVNHRVDKIIDWIKLKWKSILVLRILTLCLIVFLFVDFLLSGYAIYVFLIRASIEKNINVDNKERVEIIYHEIYDDKIRNERINKFFSPYKMLRTYPNLTITLEDGTMDKVRNYYPEIQTYYYDFDVEKNI